MSAKIPDSHKFLLTESKIFPNLATVMPDGRPQNHPIWFDYDGEYVRINTAKGRQKDENLREREYATLLFVHPDDPYLWMEVRGHVAEIIEGERAEEHIDNLALKYIGEETYPFRQEGEERVMFLIQPDRVLSYGERDE